MASTAALRENSVTEQRRRYRRGAPAPSALLLLELVGASVEQSLYLYPRSSPEGTWLEVAVDTAAAVVKAVGVLEGDPASEETPVMSTSSLLKADRAAVTSLLHRCARCSGEEDIRMFR